MTTFRLRAAVITFAILFGGFASTRIRADEVHCSEVDATFNDDHPFDHLPLPNCFQPMLYLHNHHVTSPTSISAESIPDHFEYSARTIFVVHGYRGDVEASDWMSLMKDELLKKEFYNVILADWGGGSKALWYPQSAANIRVIARDIVRLSSVLIGQGLQQDALYCVGHSLGAHTCGLAGKDVHFGRITGLDPAGPMFERYPEEARLNPSNADFVDVIHTMGDEGLIMDFGTLLPLGHADFYPNGGVDQPGCINRKRRDVDHEPLPARMKGDGLACSHGRAIDYYIESINTPCFTTRDVCTDEHDIPSSCTFCGEQCQSMGFESQLYTTTGKLFLETDKESPFCLN